MKSKGKFCTNYDCDGDYELVPGGHLHADDSVGFLKSVALNYIDPIAQVFMDFYADTHMENLRGETKLIIYQDWADKARAMMSEEINDQYDLVPKDDYPMPSPQQMDDMFFDNKFSPPEKK